DGAGTVRFYRDGSLISAVKRPGRQSIVAGSLGLSIGDRIGSYYGGFPGWLDEVRLTEGAREFAPASVQFTDARTVWVRFEPAPALRVLVRNRQPSALTGASLSVSGMGRGVQTVALPRIEPGATHEVPLPVDTTLRPDEYDVRARLTVATTPPVETEATWMLRIVPRPLPQRMPVMMWGIGGPSEFAQEWPRLKDLGFTHCLGLGADYGAIWNAEQPVSAGSPAAVTAARAMLDQALAEDLGIAASLHPGQFLKRRSELARVDRDGKPYERHDCNAALPGLAEFSERVGASVAQTYGDHPAFTAALVNSEVRDDSQVSFSRFDRDAYRKHSGRDIPEEVRIKNGVEWQKLPRFPADRVVADDDPILAYYRWFWTNGDGWNNLHTALHRGLKSTGRKDIWTWYDPAIRVPSIGGSGGEVDVLSQWTYTEPSPLRVGFYCDEVFAMAAASAHRPRVMKMTQLFWYRSSSAPIKSGQAYVASPFDDHDPDAAYISIAPMHLRGAFWSMLSRPVTGLMYHGWSALVPTDGSHAYKYTQPDLKTEFRRLHRDILAPLGPSLLQIPDRPTDVAYLDSFTAQMFARRGGYGYSGDEAYLTLLHAQLQPEVLFEESLLRNGLDRYRLLVMMDCDVLPRSVVDRVRAFQQRGGLIVGDPATLTPALRPDIELPTFRRTRKTDFDKATILANARRLYKSLAARYERYAASSDPEVVVRVRSAGASDYVFLVNDQREFGNYVGQHGLVMEQGLLTECNVTIRRTGVHVYDLLSRRQVETRELDGQTSWRMPVAPCDGRLFLVTPRAVEQVRIRAPGESIQGARLEIGIQVQDAGGQPVPAVVPLELVITDPNGRVAERSGYYGAAQGELRVPIDVAANDTPGVWQIHACELVTGRSADHYMRVAPAERPSADSRRTGPR
ncbi:MAG: hypothetical protein AB7F89_12535, partial [Pirellulaceae bacterium]